MNDRTTHPQCDLLIASTDNYLAEALLTISQLKKIGLTDRFDCHLLIGEAHAAVEGINILRRKHQGTWSSELRDGLLQLHKPYLLMWLDDLPPISISSPDRVVELIDKLIAKHGNYLRLNPTPAGNGSTQFAGAHEILPGELYRTSTVHAVWRRETLLALLDDRETAWQFEFSGAIRSDAVDGFHACDAAQVRFVNFVIKGLVDPRAERLLQEHGVDTSKITRNRMNMRRLWALRLREVRSMLLKLLPWQIRARVRYIFSTNPKSR